MSPIILSPEAITALRPGPELDHHVHIEVLGLPDEGKRKLPRYSTSTSALAVLSVVPIKVGRLAPTDPDFNETRPFMGEFTVGPIQDPRTYQMRAATPEVALCKTALLYRWAMNPHPTP